MVRISTGKAIQRRASGHPLNRRTLKTEKLLSSSPSRKSALTTDMANKPSPHQGHDRHCLTALIFRSLLFLKKQGKPPKKTRIFLSAEPLKSLGKKGKTLKKARKFLATKKARKSKKQGKEDQGGVTTGL